MLAVTVALAVICGSVRSLRRYPLRSALTILSAVMGSAGVISSVDYALGGRQKITEQLGRLGTNVLIVTPRQSRSIGGRARTGGLVTTLNEADYAYIRRDVPILSDSAAFLGRSFLVKAGNLVKNGCVVIGIEPQYLDIKGWIVQKGESFSTADVRRMARVALLGSKVAKDLFEDSSPVGERILINRVPFQIAGVLSERGQSLDSANEDDQIYIPLTVEMHRLSNVDYYGGILLGVRNWEEMDRAAEAVRQALRVRHHSWGAAAEDFQVQNPKQLLETRLIAANQLMLYVRSISVGTLVISGLGVLAISWMGVKERTREIGTRRALGAKQWHIFLQISAEAATLSLVGSVLGFALALGAATYLAQWANQDRMFDKPTAFLATMISLSVNFLFAAIPALSGAKLDPIRALHFE